MDVKLSMKALILLCDFLPREVHYEPSQCPTWTTKRACPEYRLDSRASTLLESFCYLTAPDHVDWLMSQQNRQIFITSYTNNLAFLPNKNLRRARSPILIRITIKLTHSL